MLDNTATQPIKAKTILAPFGNLHVIASGILNSIDETAGNMHQLAMSNVDEAIRSGETMIPENSIELFAKMNTLPALKDSLEDLIQKLEATLSDGSEVKADDAAPEFRSRAKAKETDVAASLNDTLDED